MSQLGSQAVLNCARSCFYQYANHLPNHLLSIELKYPDFFFTTFRFASFHFIWFCASWVLSCEFTLSKGKKLWGYVVFTTTAIRIYFASLTLICKLLFIHWISLETKCRFWIPRCLPFWATFLFWLSRFYRLSFRLFIPTF